MPLPIDPAGLLRAGGRATFRPLRLFLALGLALAVKPACGLARATAPDPPSRAADSTSWLTAPLVPGAGAPVADSALARPRAIDYLWVLRDALVDPGNVPRIVERARLMGVRGLLVQVVGRGDAWYRSDLLPYPEPLEEPGRDPLGELLPLAHAAGLEVHAWMNCCLVWSADHAPRNPRHVLHAHPEWVARLRDGRSMSRMTPEERFRRHVEGVFLSPSQPGVRTWIASIAGEIAARYPVDGIHLDYIRQPGVAIGYDPVSRAQFALAQGVDPLHFERVPAAERTRVDSAWAEYQRSQVTAIVREVRDTLERVRPGLTLSAAVLPDPLTAAVRNRQEWDAWLRDGLLDRAFPMCYAIEVQTVLDQLAAMAGGPESGRLVPGIAIYNTSPARAAAKIQGARALGYPAVALYSYDSLWERQDLWTRLDAYLEGHRTLEVNP